MPWTGVSMQAVGPEAAGDFTHCAGKPDGLWLRRRGRPGLDAVQPRRLPQPLVVSCVQRPAGRFVLVLRTLLAESLMPAIQLQPLSIRDFFAFVRLLDRSLLPPFSVFEIARFGIAGRQCV